jgi:WD40 repeat protein
MIVQYPVGDLLLVSANPDFAREEVELWAIDRSTGERRWQRKLETTHTFDEWVTHPTDQGIFLAVCAWDTDDCRFELLDLATGTSKGQVNEPAGYPFSGAAWRGNQGFLTIDGTLYAIDLRTAAIEYTWP